MALPLIELMVIGSAFFWVGFMVLSFILFFLVDSKPSLKGASVVLALVTIFLFLCGDLVPILMSASWLTILLWAAGYVVGGCIWGFARWAIFGTECTAAFADYQREWLEDKGEAGPGVPDNLKKEWKIHLLTSDRWSTGPYFYHDNEYLDPQRTKPNPEWIKTRRIVIIPSGWDKKTEITTWMMFWPWSILCQFFECFLSKFWSWLFRRFTGIFQRISDFLTPDLGLDDVDLDLEEPDAEE